MTQQNGLANEHGAMFSFSLRDVLAVGFRHRRQIILSFLAVFLGAVVYIFLRPAQFETSVKILLQQERIYPVMTSDPSAAPKISTTVTEQELNSEIALLQSYDLLEKVVVTCGLDQTQPSGSLLTRWFSPDTTKAGNPPADPNAAAQDPAKKAARYSAVQALLSSLRIELLGRSNIIVVTHKSRDPEQAVRVLNTLVELYLEKHSAIRHPTGTLSFFQQQTEHFRKTLTTVEAQLTEFGRGDGVVSPQLEKTSTLQRLDDVEARLKETKVAIAEKEELIRALEAQLAQTPARIVTEVRTSDNHSVVQGLKSTLSALEIKRIELLTKYEPTYRAVQEVDQQIAHLRAKIAEEEKVVLREESSDLDQKHEALKSDLLKAQSELAALRARAVNTAQDVRAYRDRVQYLYQKELASEELLRSRRMAEEGYQLYLRKQEEARISNALDKEQILNVTLLEKTPSPPQPSGPSRSLMAFLAVVFAGVVSSGLALASDYLKPSFHSPAQVESYLNLPVIAALPSNPKQSKT